MIMAYLPAPKRSAELCPVTAASGGHVALLDQGEEPADGLLELGVVVVVVGAPGVLVGELEVVGAGVHAPLGLAHAAAGAAVQAEAVDLDLALVEARLVAALAVLVHGQVGDGLLVGAAVGRVPGQLAELVGGHSPPSSASLLVVEERDGVEVLGQAVALAVLALPQIGQARLVLVDVEAVLGQGVVQRDQLLLGDELRVLRQVVGEHVGRVAGDEAVGELAPVVVPAELADLDVDVRVGRLEVVRAGLVRGLLGVVPQPVVDVAGGGAGVDRPAFGAVTAFVLAPAAATGGEGQAQGGQRRPARPPTSYAVLAIVGRSFRFGHLGGVTGGQG